MGYDRAQVLACGATNQVMAALQSPHFAGGIFDFPCGGANHDARNATETLLPRLKGRDRPNCLELGEHFAGQACWMLDSHARQACLTVVRPRGRR